MTAPEQTADELVILVIRAAKAMVDRLKSERPGGAASPMTAVHGLAARYLVGRDDVTQGELARYLRVTKQSASEIVAVLEEEGLVRRAPHPSDGRARVVRLTAAGRKKLDTGRARWRQLEAEWAGLIGDKKIAVVRDALEQYLAYDATQVTS